MEHIRQRFLFYGFLFLFPILIQSQNSTVGDLVFSNLFASSYKVSVNDFLSKRLSGMLHTIKVVDIESRDFS